MAIESDFFFENNIKNHKIRSEKSKIQKKRFKKPR